MYDEWDANEWLVRRDLKGSDRDLFQGFNSLENLGNNSMEHSSSWEANSRSSSQ
jgi:hypothetical protein